MNNNMYNNMNNANGMNTQTPNVNGMNTQTPNVNGMNTQTPNVNGMNTQVNNTNTMANGYSQVYQAPQTDPMAAVANLNKEDAMEEALSHTNQYTPFEAPKQEVLEESKKGNPKSAYIFLGIIVVILALFIAFLPQISKLFGW